MPSSENFIANQVSRAQEKITGKKFCFRCAKERSIEGGKHVLTGKTKAWRCAVCLNKQNPGGFTKKEIT